MHINLETLRDAVRRGVITESEAVSVWTHLQTQQTSRGTRAEAATMTPLPVTPPWRPPVVALLVAVISAFVTLIASWLFGPAGLAVTAAALSVSLLALGRRRHLRNEVRVGQVFVSSAVVLAPVAVLGLVRALGLGGGGDSGHPLADWLFGPWFPVLATAIAGSALGLRSFRIPFLAAVLGAAVWLAAQDAAPVLFGDDPAWSQRALLSSLTGLVLLAAGLAFDRRTRADHAFWLYLPGLLAFCGGLTTLQAEDHASILLVSVLHVGLVAGSLLLERRTFAVAGALGLAAAAGHVADDLLDGKALSFALTGIALAVIGLGLLYHLHHERLEGRLAAVVPAPLRRLLPPGVRAATRS